MITSKSLFAKIRLKHKIKNYSICFLFNMHCLWMIVFSLSAFQLFGLQKIRLKVVCPQPSASLQKSSLAIHTNSKAENIYNFNILSLNDRLQLLLLSV